MELTDKQQRFINEYMIDQNATQAYMRAGYKVRSDASAKAAASRMLTNVNVREKIDAGLAALAAATGMTAKETWHEVANIARCSIAAFLDVSGVVPKLKPSCEISEDAWKTLKSVKVRRYTEWQGENAREVEVIEYTLWDKLAANVTMLKGLGELKDTKKHESTNGVEVVTIEVVTHKLPGAEPETKPNGPASAAK